MTRLINLIRFILPTRFKQSAKRALGLPSARIHPDWQILESVPRVLSAHVVMDLGARNGWFFSSWKKWCPQAEVHAFEPEKIAYQNLSTQYADDSTVHINAEGVGSEQTVESFYHLTESEVSSSFLPPLKQAWDDIGYRTGEVAVSEVALTTLDHYAKSHEISSVYLIKIDIQGYELKALQGATELLKKTDYLLVESSLKPLYEGAARFTEVHDFLAEHGFHLMDLRAWHRGNEVLIESDLLFRRNDLAPKLDDDQEIDRIYIGHR